MRERPCASNSVARTDDERREVAPPLVAAATAAIPVVAPMDDDDAACGDRALELALAACVWRSGERGEAKALAMAAEGEGRGEGAALSLTVKLECAAWPAELCGDEEWVEGVESRKGLTDRKNSDQHSGGRAG